MEYVNDVQSFGDINSVKHMIQKDACQNSVGSFKEKISFSLYKKNVVMMNKIMKNLKVQLMLSNAAVDKYMTKCDDKYINIIWCGTHKHSPHVLFLKPYTEIEGDMFEHSLTYKITKTEVSILKHLLNHNGFHEDLSSNQMNANFIWTGYHIKPTALRKLGNNQKINHFPRSYELTRKDCLIRNIQKMQVTKGLKHFDFLPESFVLPKDINKLCSYYYKEKRIYIVKPVASSRGRGIFLCDSLEQIPVDEPLIVSRYIDNPLLIDGFKFDIRLYVAVTSYNPLVIYIFEEGLVRFATIKYKKGHKYLHLPCMHLTNYSINKKNNEFMYNDNPDIEDFGNKWSLGGLLRYLKCIGKDTALLMMKIEDVIIKTILSVETTISTACKMFQSHSNICYEMYGFDILVDDNMRPWLLEVNLSPSLMCDSPLDYKIKSHMLIDLFNLVGIPCGDILPNKVSSKDETPNNKKTESNLINSVEHQVFRRLKDEEARCGGWLRIYPSRDSWQMYNILIESDINAVLSLHKSLYPNVWNPNPYLYVNTTSKIQISLHNIPETFFKDCIFTNDFQCNYFSRIASYYISTAERCKMYQKKLSGESREDIQKDALKEYIDKHENSNLSLNHCYKDQLVESLKEGRQMSQIEARNAFLAYVSRLEQRINSKAFANSSTDQLEKLEYFIENFLKRASYHFQDKIYHFCPPPKSHNLQKRLSILGKSLSSFIAVYSKHTHHTDNDNYFDFIECFNSMSDLELTKLLRNFTLLDDSFLNEPFNSYLKEKGLSCQDKKTHIIGKKEKKEVSKHLNSNHYSSNASSIKKNLPIPSKVSRGLSSEKNLNLLEAKTIKISSKERPTKSNGLKSSAAKQLKRTLSVSQIPYLRKQTSSTSLKGPIQTSRLVYRNNLPRIKRSFSQSYICI